MTVRLISNTPELWLDAFPRPLSEDHKYKRGHAVIFAAPELTGATRLAAEACSRMGAGLVTVLAAERSDVYRMTLPADIMVRDASLSDLRHPTTALIGPGGVHPNTLDDLTREHDLQTLVVDADGMNHVREMQEHGKQMILTPHEGELTRCLTDMQGTREQRAREAARIFDSIVMLKGHETLVAHPDGTLVRNIHATAWLAKAGTGDVLAGLITGLAAQGMDPFLASAAAVWIHGDAALKIGSGLMASDLQTRVPEVLKDLGIH